MNADHIVLAVSYMYHDYDFSFLAKEYAASIKELNEKLERRPDIASELKWKIKDLEEKRDVVLSEEKTSMALDSLEPVFDRLERNLERSKKG